MTILTDIAGKTTITSVKRAAAEVGLAVPPDALLPLLWLTLVVHRAGLGMPPDPMRVKSWTRFGRSLAEDEKPAIGDIGISVEAEAVGIITMAGRKNFDLLVSPDTIVTIPHGKALAVRRPLADPSPVSAA